MAYYNRNGEKFNSEGMKFLNRGNCANVFFDCEKIFKVYFSSCDIDYKMTSIMFDILKDIHNPHFIELFDIYQKSSFLESFLCKMDKDFLLADAYTAKYYKKENINILYEPIDYLIDNVRELELLFGIFADNAICVNDLHLGNLLFTSQRIIILDPDLFYRCTTETLKINKRRLLYAFRKVLIESLTDESECKLIKKKIKNKLTAFKPNNNTDIAFEFSRRLKGYKRPIDYLSKK